MIKSQLHITYKLTKEDLGQSYLENKKFIEQCIEFKESLDQEIEGLRVKKTGEVTHSIKLLLNKIQGFGEEYEDSKSNTLQVELSTLDMQRAKEISDIASEFGQQIKLISEKQETGNMLKSLISSKKNDTDYYSQNVLELEAELQQNKKYTNDQKFARIDQISKQVIELQKQEKDLQEKEQEEIKQEYEKKMKKISSLQSTISLNKVQKSCFHTIFVVDESGSFNGTPHNNGIQGIIQFVNQLAPNDYASVIKFHSFASVKFQKTLKCQINIKSLRSSIQNCAQGGTDFTSAFQQLQQYVRNNVSNNEYLIVIFITDGQDRSLIINEVSQKIKEQCDEFTFFTVGYGSVSEQQLQIITNVMNSSKDCTKSINGKRLQLYYKNNSPEQLLNDLTSIKEQISKVSLEDIEKEQKAIEALSKSFTDNISKFYVDRRNVISTKIQQLSSEKNHFMNFDDKQLRKQFEDKVSSLKLEISKCEKEINNFQTQINTLIIDQEEIRNSLKKKYIEGKDETLEEIRNQVQDHINNKFKQEESKILKQIQEEENQMKENLQNQLSSLNKYGFQTLEKFNNFYKELSSFQNVQIFFTNIVDNLLSMVDNLQSVSELLDRNIVFSSNSLKQLNDSNTVNRFIEYFKRYDDSISETDLTDAKQKILFITDNSASKIAQEYCEERFYLKVVLLINLPEILKISEDQKLINTQLKLFIAEVIPPSREEANSAERIKISKSRISKQQDSLEKLQEQLEKGQGDTTKLEDKISALEEKIEGLQQEDDELKEEISKIQQQNEEENQSKLQIIKLTFNTMIQAVKNSILRNQYKASIMPFVNYVCIQNASQKALKEY